MEKDKNNSFEVSSNGIRLEGALPIPEICISAVFQLWAPQELEWSQYH